MRPSNLLPLGLAALCLPLAAHAAFEDNFALVGPESPAGFYTVAHDVYLLGSWSAIFSPAEGGQSFIDTTNAPASATIASSSAATEDYAASETVMFIEMPLGGHVSFTIDVFNDATAGAYAQLEIYISGETYYLTEAGSTPHQLGFDIQAGDTLEFRSVSVSIVPGASASNIATLSNFAFVASAIPEPSSFAMLAGLVALGFVGRRRRETPAQAA